MKTALISVYNKEGIVEFAKELVVLEFKILASGGTAKALSDAGIEVTDISTLVGRPILDHRVVTLSREIHAGLLARDGKEDRIELEKLKIPWIDLVCVDLYPLEEEIAKWITPQPLSPSPIRLRSGRPRVLSSGSAGSGHSPQVWGEQKGLEAIIEQTDIGGPTLLRAAAKGRRIVICDPTDRFKVIKWLKSKEPNRENFLTELAAKAEFMVSNYALISARFHSRGKIDGLLGEQSLECKYGENAWQTPAGLFDLKSDDRLSLSKFQLVTGTAPSYNNWCDVDRMLQTMTHIAAAFDVNFGKVPFIAVGVKHGNACGASIGDNPLEVLQKMLEGDLRAIFGGVVMTNFTINEELAETLLTYQMGNNQRRLLDGIIAPAFLPEAVGMLKRKSDKCRFLMNPALENLSKNSLDNHLRFRYVRGGFLRQPNYTFVLDLKLPDLVKTANLSTDQEKDLLLAWAVGSTSNSNTVTLVKDLMLVGNGVGQQDRVGGCELAIKRSRDAGHDPHKAVAYSDSFFPFVDGPRVLAEAGVSVILATSGSVRDEEIKKFCLDHSLTLVMLPDIKARGFFGH